LSERVNEAKACQTGADEREPGAVRGDDKIIRDKIIGQETWQENELARIGAFGLV